MVMILGPSVSRGFFSRSLIPWSPRRAGGYLCFESCHFSSLYFDGMDAPSAVIFIVVISSYVDHVDASICTALLRMQGLPSS